MSKPPTFKEAKENILNWLENEGYEVKRNLKVPWARSRDTGLKYYLKEQAIYTGNYDCNLGECNSLCSDMRQMRIAKVILMKQPIREV